MNNNHRTCSQICIDADNNANDIDYIYDLWKYVSTNKHDYTTAEIDFIREHLVNYYNEICRIDAKKLKQLIDEWFN